MSTPANVATCGCPVLCVCFAVGACLCVRSRDALVLPPPLRPGNPLVVTSNSMGVATIKDSVSVVVSNPLQFNEVIRMAVKKACVPCVAWLPPHLLSRRSRFRVLPPYRASSLLLVVWGLCGAAFADTLGPARRTCTYEYGCTFGGRLTAWSALASCTCLTWPRRRAPFPPTTLRWRRTRPRTWRWPRSGSVGALAAAPSGPALRCTVLCKDVLFRAAQCSILPGCVRMCACV